MHRLICLTIILAILLNMLTGCFDRREIDELAYVIALGIDKGKTNFLKITFQIAIPKGLGGGEGGGGGGGEENILVVSVEAPSLYSGINLANTFISRQLNLSHAKAIIFSKELAQDPGIEIFINALMRGREFRPNMGVLISQGSAESFIQSVKPKLEANPAKYYEMILNSYNYTSFIGKTRLVNFYNQSGSTSSQSVATLAGVSKFKSSEDINLSGSTNKEKGKEYVFEGDFKAGKITKYGELEAEYMGLAVFNGGRMVGDLDGEETGFYLMSTGDYNYAYWTIPDPNTKGMFCVLNVRQSRKPRHSIKMVEAKPQIDIKVILEADIISIQSGINYEDINKLPQLEQAAEQYFKEGMQKMYSKTAKEFNCDICGFGEHIKSKFLTWKEWEDFHWLDKYKDANFNVDVDLKVRRPGLTIRTIHMSIANNQGGKSE